MLRLSGPVCRPESCAVFLTVLRLLGRPVNHTLMVCMRALRRVSDRAASLQCHGRRPEFHACVPDRLRLCVATVTNHTLRNARRTLLVMPTGANVQTSGGGVVQGSAPCF